MFCFADRKDERVKLCKLKPAALMQLEHHKRIGFGRLREGVKRTCRPNHSINMGKINGLIGCYLLTIGDSHDWHSELLLIRIAALFMAYCNALVWPSVLLWRVAV